MYDKMGETLARVGIFFCFDIPVLDVPSHLRLCAKELNA
jgi:hypothetical protein